MVVLWIFTILLLVVLILYSNVPFLNFKSIPLILNYKISPIIYFYKCIYKFLVQSLLMEVIMKLKNIIIIFLQIIFLNLH